MRLIMIRGRVRILDWGEGRYQRDQTFTTEKTNIRGHIYKFLNFLRNYTYFLDVFEKWRYPLDPPLITIDTNKINI
jgi:hypothetical protein